MSWVTAVVSFCLCSTKASDVLQMAADDLSWSPSAGPSHLQRHRWTLPSWLAAPFGCVDSPGRVLRDDLEGGHVLLAVWWTAERHSHWSRWSPFQSLWRLAAGGFWRSALHAPGFPLWRFIEIRAPTAVAVSPILAIDKYRFLKRSTGRHGDDIQVTWWKNDPFSSSEAFFQWFRRGVDDSSPNLISWFFYSGVPMKCRQKAEPREEAEAANVSAEWSVLDLQRTERGHFCWTGARSKQVWNESKADIVWKLDIQAADHQNKMWRMLPPRGQQKLVIFF